MKKAILILSFVLSGVLIFSPLCVSAQETESIPTHISPLQAGTVTIDNGTATVNLTKSVLQQLSHKDNSPSYYVLFTSLTDGCDIILTNKGEQSFSVKVNSSNHIKSAVQADYVVFVRSNMKKMLPSDHAKPQLIQNSQKSK